MNVTCDNGVFTHESNDEIFREMLKDPFDDVNTYEDNPKYYRLNETVFAEPIQLVNDDVETGAVTDSQLKFIDNVIVQKRPGKRTKYLIKLCRNSSTPKCPQKNCKKTFSSIILLQAHIRRVHCAERNKYICECCAAGFSASYLLQRHMAVHSKQRVECPLCGKMLSSRTNMSVHLRRHSNTRPHTCNLCNRAFVRRATLNSHVRFVHRTGDLCCHRCDERFSSRKLLMQHKCCQPK